MMAVWFFILFFFLLCFVTGSHSQNLFAQYEFISINTIILWMRFDAQNLFILGDDYDDDGSSDGIDGGNVDGNGDSDAKCTKIHDETVY